MKIFGVFLIAVLLISGCSTKTESPVKGNQDSNVSIELKVTGFGQLTEFYSVSSDGVIRFGVISDKTNETYETYYTKNIEKKDLLDLANFIAAKGFFKKTFNSSVLIMDRVPAYGKTLTVFINNDTKSVKFGDLIIIDDVNILDEIANKIEALGPKEKIIKPNKECFDSVKELRLYDSPTSSKSCKTDSDCVFLNEGFYIQGSNKTSVVQHITGIEISINKEKLEEIESKIQILKNNFCKDVKSVNITLNSLQHNPMKGFIKHPVCSPQLGYQCTWTHVLDVKSLSG